MRASHPPLSLAVDAIKAFRDLVVSGPLALDACDALFIGVPHRCPAGAEIRMRSPRRSPHADRFVRGLLVKSAPWIAGLPLTFVPLAIRLYRRLT